jgi:hypothetical protein
VPALRDRFAATLVLPFGRPIDDVVYLTWADVSITEALESVTLGRTSMVLPDPLHSLHRMRGAQGFGRCFTPDLRRLTSSAMRSARTSGRRFAPSTHFRYALR